MIELDFRLGLAQNTMQTATVGKIQKNFAKILREINTGEEVIITRRGKPVARLTALGPGKNIHWPDFFKEAIPAQGKPISSLIAEEREDRF